MMRYGFDAARNPILALETIECRDALRNPDGTVRMADVIVDNPPFLGGNVMRRI